MINPKLFFAVLLLCVAPTVFSQNPIKTYTVKGQVVDSASATPVPYATVSILADSASQDYIKRAAADVDGKFEMEIRLEKPSCLLTVEATGQDKLEKQIDFRDETKINLGKILMREFSNMLENVEIVAIKPLVTQDIDRIGYDVESDPESKTNTVIEMLRKVPLVTVDQDDEIKVKGSASFKIYINGKPSNMITKNPKDVLKSMPASSVKKIEVITDPGAKYDSEGVTAILNIVTQSVLQGYTGSVRTSASTRGQYGLGGYLQTKIGKFGITANAAWQQYGSPSWSESTTENLGQNMPYKFSNTSSESTYKNMYQYGTLEASYEIDSLNLVSVSVSFFSDGSKQPSRISRTFMMNQQGDTISAYNSSGSSEYKGYSIDGNIDYQRTFKKADQLLTFSYLFDLSPSNSQSISIIEYNNSYPNLLQTTRPMNQKYFSLGKTDSHTLQIDYTEPFDSSKHVVEGGVKYTLRINASDNDYKLYNAATNAYDLDTVRPNGNNNMLYQQHIFGAYFSYVFKLKKFSIRAGGRFEGTISDVRFPETPERNFRVAFPSLVPSVALSYRPVESTTLRLSYNNGISRPGIWYLNPYVDDSNPYYISHGNPNLKPERSHNVSVSYGLVKQKFNLNVSLYSGTVTNSIESVQTVDSAGVITSTYDNIGLWQRFAGNVYLNWNPVKWLRIWAQGNAGHIIVRNNSYRNSAPSFSAYGGIQTTLPWKIRFNINSGGQSPYSGYKYKSTAYYYYSGSLSRNFLKDEKLTVTFSASNPFEKYRNSTSSSWEDGVYNTSSVSKYLSRNFSLSVSWRFGEMKAEIRKTERGITNDDVKSGGGGGGGRE